MPGYQLHLLENRTNDLNDLGSLRVTDPEIANDFRVHPERYV